MDYDKIPYVAARKAGKGREWEAPSGLTVDWLKNLSGGVRVPLGEVIYLLAFGPSMSPDGRSEIVTDTERIIAARGLFKAATDCLVEIYGQRCEQLMQPLLGPPGMRLLAPGGRIDPAEFANDRLTLGPIGGLCLTAIAEKPGLWAQPDGWKCAEAVRYCKVTIDHESLRAWLYQLSGKVPNKRGRPPEYPWKELKDETFRLMDFHGDFTRDDDQWDFQARLEEELIKLCGRLVSREPSSSQLRSYIADWLKEWRSVKVTDGN
jgi:hypothetical protein